MRSHLGVVCLWECLLFVIEAFCKSQWKDESWRWRMHLGGVAPSVRHTVVVYSEWLPYEPQRDQIYMCRAIQLLGREKFRGRC